MSNIKKYVHKTTLPNGTFVNNMTLCTVEYSDRANYSAKFVSIHEVW